MRARDAKPLLLAAGNAHARLLEIVLHFVPERGHAERFLEPLVEDAAVAHAVQAQADEDIFLDRHGRERIRFLKDHADAAADHRRIDSGGDKGLRRRKESAPSTRVLRHEFVHPVEATEEGRFAATARPDDGGDGLAPGCRSRPS